MSIYKSSLFDKNFLSSNSGVFSFSRAPQTFQVSWWTMANRFVSLVSNDGYSLWTGIFGIIHTCIHPTLSKQNLHATIFQQIGSPNDEPMFQSDLGVSYHFWKLDARASCFPFYRETQSWPHASLASFLIRLHSFLAHRKQRPRDNCQKKSTSSMEPCKRNVCFRTCFIFLKYSSV